MSFGRRKKARSARPRSGNGKEEGWAAGEDERFKHVPEDPRFVPLKVWKGKRIARTGSAAGVLPVKADRGRWALVLPG